MDTNERTNRHAGPSKSTWVLVGFIAVAAYFLFSEHRAHFIGFLPYLLLAACPLMHLFHGHGHHRNVPPRDVDKAPRLPSDPHSQHQH